MIENKYSVFISCNTFNQAIYIKDALDSFCMQQTSFPFVCAITDDASTDGEIDVIKQYLQDNFNLNNEDALKKETDDYVLQYARHKTNRNCFFVVVFLKYNHWQLKKAKKYYVKEWFERSRYSAYCEGDDYWIDPLKLQKQVDFLEKHPDYSAHATERLIIDGEGTMIQRKTMKSQDFTAADLDKLAIKMQFQISTLLCRISCFKDKPQRLSWDTGMFCWLLTKGKIRFDNYVTSTYRMGVGVTRKTDRMRWNEQNERWSNILYEEFYPKYMTHTGAYLSLTRDILSLLMNNKELTASDREILKKRYKKYSSFDINVRNIPYGLLLLRNRVLTLFRSISLKR